MQLVFLIFLLCFFCLLFSLIFHSSAFDRPDCACVGNEVSQLQREIMRKKTRTNCKQCNSFLEIIWVRVDAAIDCLGSGGVQHIEFDFVDLCHDCFILFSFNFAPHSRSVCVRARAFIFSVWPVARPASNLTRLKRAKRKPIMINHPSDGGGTGAARRSARSRHKAKWFRLFRCRCFDDAYRFASSRFGRGRSTAIVCTRNDRRSDETMNTSLISLLTSAPAMRSKRNDGIGRSARDAAEERKQKHQNKWWWTFVVI